MKRKFSLHGWLGIFLMVLFWYLNWNLEGLRTHWGFFPLWLGFVLTIDALTLYRKGSSLFSRNKKMYLLLFLLSAPAWWLFELFNSVTNNWHYDGKEFFSDFEYALLATLSFSTVMPAVFGAAEFAGTFKWIENLKPGPAVKPDKNNILLFAVTGLIFLFLLLSMPQYFYPLIWLTLFFLIEPLNVFLKNNSILDFTAKRDWRVVISLWIGCLICAFFWEMWNYYSYPKWKYDLPGLNYLHIFEMPAAGYLGYLPFSLELYAIYNLAAGIFKSERMKNYLEIAAAQGS